MPSPRNILPFRADHVGIFLLKDQTTVPGPVIESANEVWGDT